jgi:hypothetical protein
MSDWEKHMRALLGKQVEVVLSRDPDVRVRGVLHQFTDDGEICVREDDLTFRWAWPNLDTQEIGQYE